MLEKLLIVLLSGAVVTVSGLGGIVSDAVGDAVVQAAPSPTPGPLPDVPPAALPFAAVVPGDAGTPVDADPPPVARDAPQGRPAARAPASPCASETAARDAAYARVEAAFTLRRAALEDVRGARPAATVAQADEMLGSIAGEAKKVIAQIGACREGDPSEPVDQDGEDMGQVADRAVAAMETVYNLAKDGALAAPTTPKPAEKKPVAKATPKPSKTPSCDDRVYESKKVLAAAFERFHGANDILWKKAEATKSPAFATVKSADRVMHETYDSTKAAILKAGCAGDAGMRLANTATATLERAYLAAKSAVESSARR